MEYKFKDVIIKICGVPVGRMVQAETPTIIKPTHFLMERNFSGTISIKINRTLKRYITLRAKAFSVKYRLMNIGKTHLSLYY